MTDQQLIDWIYRKLASDWSRAQLRRLGRRVKASFAVRAAFRERIALEQALCQTLSPAPWSAAQLLAASKAPAPAGDLGAAGNALSTTLSSGAAWVLGVLLVGVLATYFAVTQFADNWWGSNAPPILPDATLAPLPAVAPAQPAQHAPPLEAPDAPEELPPARAGSQSRGDDESSPSDLLPHGPAPLPPLPTPLPAGTAP